VASPTLIRAHIADTAIGWHRRPLPSAAVLFVVLAGLMLVTDPMGFLSTDVGGKIATLEAMDRSGSLSPDLGYWAEAADPEGALYPMFSTAHVDGKWINATSLPMLLIALPIYKVGGALAAGLIPVLGTLLAAFGARALAQRLGRDDQADGMTAFWIVGLASPATVYALDFWEQHSSSGRWRSCLMLRRATVGPVPRWRPGCFSASRPQCGKRRWSMASSPAVRSASVSSCLAVRSGPRAAAPPCWPALR